LTVFADWAIIEANRTYF